MQVIFFDCGISQFRAFRDCIMLNNSLAGFWLAVDTCILKLLITTDSKDKKFDLPTADMQKLLPKSRMGVDPLSWPVQFTPVSFIYPWMSPPVSSHLTSPCPSFTPCAISLQGLPCLHHRQQSVASTFTTPKTIPRLPGGLCRCDAGGCGEGMGQCAGTWNQKTHFRLGSF